MPKTLSAKKTSAKRIRGCRSARLGFANPSAPAETRHRVRFRWSCCGFHLTHDQCDGAFHRNGNRRHRSRQFPSTRWRKMEIRREGVSRLRRPGGTLGAEKVRGRRATYRRVCRLFRNRRRRCHPRGGFASAGARTRACLCVDWGGGKWSAVSPVPRGNRAIEKAN
jgi:hypothetical protein